jgi:hypothetical protein
LDDRAQAGIVQVAQTVLDWIGFRCEGELVHHAFVREGVLQAAR